MQKLSFNEAYSILSTCEAVLVAAVARRTVKTVTVPRLILCNGRGPRVFMQLRLEAEDGNFILVMFSTAENESVPLMNGALIFQSSTGVFYRINPLCKMVIVEVKE